MPHLIEPSTEPVEVVAFRAGLEGAHLALVEVAKQWSFSEIPPESWGVSAKRAFVQVEGSHPWVGVTSQPFNELVNQLATVERLLDALKWAESVGFSLVLACHPTTSSGDHDLVVRRPDQTLGVFEVSDVAGPRGNENNKMANDLNTLANCNCQFCRSGAAKYLATSSVSGQWLEKQVGHAERIQVLEMASLHQVSVGKSGTTITELTPLASRPAES